MLSVNFHQPFLQIFIFVLPQNIDIIYLCDMQLHTADNIIVYLFWTTLKLQYVI